MSLCSYVENICSCVEKTCPYVHVSKIYVHLFLCQKSLCSSVNFLVYVSILLLYIKKTHFYPLDNKKYALLPPMSLKKIVSLQRDSAICAKLRAHIPCNAKNRNEMRSYAATRHFTEGIFSSSCYSRCHKATGRGESMYPREKQRSGLSPQH